MTGLIDPLDAIGDAPVDTPDPQHDGALLLARVRDLVLQAHPEVVPELVGGASITELLASVDPARQAYADLVARIQPVAIETPALPNVPAGGMSPAPFDLDRVPTAEKLRRGLEARAAQ